MFSMAVAVYAHGTERTSISGKVFSSEDGIVEFATVYLKATNHGGTTDHEGVYQLNAPAGDYTLVVQALGYKTVEKTVKLIKGETVKHNIKIVADNRQLDEVSVVSTGVSRVKRSA